MPRLTRVASPALLLLAGLIILFVALAYGGGAAAPPENLASTDPGAVVRWGLPVAKMLVNISAAATLGPLIMVFFAFSKGKPEFDKAMDVAAAGAAAWTVSAGATGFLMFLAATSTTEITFDDNFGQILAQYLTGYEIGQAWLATTLMAAVLTVLCFAVRNLTMLVFVTVLGVASLVPMSLLGHQGGTADHDAATSAIFLHVLFAAIWLGGLLTIALLRPALESKRIVTIVSRYSTVALLSFIIVAVSGYVSAEIRVGGLESLLSPYGVLVLGKVALLIVLGLFGALHRRYVIDRMSRPTARMTGWFWWLVAAELGFMGLASGLAAALARTPTPVPDLVLADLPESTPAEVLTGRPLPPPPSFENYLTLWNVDLIWLVLCGLGLFFYLAGVWRLRKRGDAWPWFRTVSWSFGILVLFWVTNGGINAYESFLFSSHMLAHMILGMMVPVLLVPGAPITLAMRAIRKRDDGSRGPRETLLLLVHSWYFRIVGNPIVAAVIFTGSLWVFYYTPLFRWATTDHIGHQWMIIHFLAAGYLFVQALVGIDPSPHRPPYALRLLLLLAVMAFHAFFGLALMTGTGLLLADWYGAMGWDTGLSALEDQRIGGGIAWSIGEAPTLALAVAVMISWARSDRKEQKRYDRKADRDGEAELEEYNRMLEERAKRG